MTYAPLFRSVLASRLLAALGAAAVAVPLVDCGGGGGGGGTTATSGAAGAGGSGATTGAGGAPATSTTTGTILSGVGVGGASTKPPEQQCFEPTPGVPCPTDMTIALNEIVSAGCPTGWEASSILAGPTLGKTPGMEGWCCYQVTLGLCAQVGRPYVVDGASRVAPVATGRPETEWMEGASPSVDGLTAGERAFLSAAWLEDALLEHASVASFSRFSLALLAVGAPADLLVLAHEAALDEVRHAQLCFALAAGYRGEAVAPGRFPFVDVVTIPESLADLAVSTWREGCIGETLGAVLAAEQLAGATDPAVRAALARLVEDESRHAELAWRTVAWAVGAGGPEVRVAVERAVRQALDAGASAPPTGTPAPFSPALAAHGRLAVEGAQAAVRAAMRDVVAPCARALLVREAAAPARQRLPVSA